MIKKFMEDNSLEARLIRTIVQGIIAVLIVALPLCVGGIIQDPQIASIVTALVMAVLSPIMAMLKTGNPEDGLNEDTSAITNASQKKTEVKDEKELLSLLAEAGHGNGEGPADVVEVKQNGE